MSKVTIGKKEYAITEDLMNQCELQFYEDNPRVYSILRANGSTPTQDEIEEKLTSMDHVRQLRLSIEQNGGIIDPLVVVERNGKYIVLEGNSRLAAYRLLAKKDPIKWQKVKVDILPSNITDNDIFTLLGQYHLIGRKDWSVFEQAAYLYRQKKTSNLENDIITKNVGLTKSRVKSYLNVYQFMLDHDDLRPDRWSYYEEYLKSRSIGKYRYTYPEMDETFVTQVKTGKIKQAMDVRTVLGEVAKPKDKSANRIMKDFIADEIDIYDAQQQLIATGKTGNSYQRISKFREQISDKDFQKNLLLEATNNKSIKFELKKIKLAIDKLIKTLD